MRRLLGILLLVGGLLSPDVGLAPAPAPTSPTERADQKEQVVYGSRRSNVYHRVTCRYVRQINPDNLISFPSKAEAEKGGYRACKVCRP